MWSWLMTETVKILENWKELPVRATNSTLTEPIPRLIRFVEGWELPQLPSRLGETTLSMLDEENNLLFVNQEMYDKLDALDRDRVLKTRYTFMYATLN
jgi:hypothetical protein